MKIIPNDMQIGSIHSTNSNGDLKIIDYISNKSVFVQFIISGGIKNAAVSSIRKGLVKDNLTPSVYGIGFIGYGKFKSRVKGKPTNSYSKWHGMIARCYCEITQKRQPTYKGCTVCEEWHNFQNFAQWYYENYPDDGGYYDLDKDILINGNKIYSPLTCIFVSQGENRVKAAAKEYKFKDPNGNEVLVYNLAKFGRDNNLHAGCLSWVHSGKYKSHKGWTRA